MDGPGFYTTRILAPYLNEAVLLVEEGARIEDVDRAMKDFGYPVGPLALVDEVGIDVGAHVARDLGRAFADRGLEGSGAMPSLFEAGLHGRKNRRGFYLYPEKKKRLWLVIALFMAAVLVHCLQEGVISSPRDGDLGAILGLGFPPFRGGPFRHVDTVGREAIRARLEELAGKHGKRFEPAEILTEAVEKRGKFYS